MQSLPSRRNWPRACACKRRRLEGREWIKELSPMPSVSPDDLIDFLKGLGVAVDLVDHPPVYTVAEARALRGAIPGGHTKNLFLRDKKGALYLLVALEDAVIDLKRLHTLIGASGRLSFGSAELLAETWGVNPGSVTPFGAINDTTGRVRVVLEKTMMELERLNFHPLINTQTIGLASAELVRFLRSTGHEPEIIQFAAAQ
jgi:Ala-tRNA(Pro) deacylase